MNDRNQNANVYTAYLLVFLNKETLEITNVGIYSEKNPTCSAKELCFANLDWQATSNSYQNSKNILESKIWFYPEIFGCGIISHLVANDILRGELGDLLIHYFLRHPEIWDDVKKIMEKKKT